MILSPEARQARLTMLSNYIGAQPKGAVIMFIDIDTALGTNICFAKSFDRHLFWLCLRGSRRCYLKKPGGVQLSDERNAALISDIGHRSLKRKLKKETEQNYRLLNDHRDSLHWNDKASIERRAVIGGSCLLALRNSEAERKHAAPPVRPPGPMLPKRT